MINTLINKIKEIDSALDAYEFRGYTYEEYCKDKQDNKHGMKSLRHAPMYNKNGANIWSNVMQNSIDRAKQITNKLYLADKNRYKLSNDDMKEIMLLIKRLNEVKEIFYKNTDGLSTYPVQAEIIYDNINDIINILNKAHGKEKTDNMYIS